MSPSNTVFVRGIMHAPVLIRSLPTGSIQTLLSGNFALSVVEVLGLQAEADRRRERRKQRWGRHPQRYAPLLYEAGVRAVGTGHFDPAYFAHQDEWLNGREAPIACF